MIRFLSLRLRGNLSCVTSARQCRRSAIMGASPEMFRGVDGSRGNRYDNSTHSVGIAES